MPTPDLESQRPDGAAHRTPIDGWAMPLGRIGGIRFSVSYAVFVALAVLAGMIAMIRQRPGAADLPVVATAAVAVWMLGWMVQVTVFIALHLTTAAKSDCIKVGLLGVELPNPLYRSHPWSAAANLAVACLSVGTLVTLGLAAMFAHVSVTSGGLDDFQVWRNALSARGFGMQAGSNRFLTAAWLLWIQAVCQLYPLPRNLGRAGLVSMIGLFAAEASDALQVRLLRRSLQLIAIVTILIAMASLIVDADDVLPKWPVLAVVSVMLWVSSTHHDLYDWIASIHVAKTDPISQRYGNGVEVTESVPEKARRYDPSKQSANVQWVSAVADSVRMYRKRKRARAVWKREREEASDAARLDQVLKQVSEFGTAGLSAEDKALLNRVSEALRKHRQTEHDNAPGRKDQD